MKNLASSVTSICLDAIVSKRTNIVVRHMVFLLKKVQWPWCQLFSIRHKCNGFRCLITGDWFSGCLIVFWCVVFQSCASNPITNLSSWSLSGETCVTSTRRKMLMTLLKVSLYSVSMRLKSPIISLWLIQHHLRCPEVLPESYMKQ